MTMINKAGSFLQQKDGTVYHSLCCIIFCYQSFGYAADFCWVNSGEFSNRAIQDISFHIN